MILDLTLNSSKLSGLSQVRGVFRLFRIFLLYRKANTFKKIAKQRIKTGGYDFKSPVEKVLELLEVLRDNTTDKGTIKEINW